ncbi:MAG TPA: ATP-binding protein [Actinocrinis sp.]|nr:ATP-binding protein [Actinocrinis sp.]
MLRYWRAIELFSPNTIPHLDHGRFDQGETSRVFPVHDGRPLPWEAGSPIARRPAVRNKVWQHTVYAGVFDLRVMRDRLCDIFPGSKDGNDHDGRISGHSALFCFTVTEDGYLIKKSAVVSTCAWACGRALSPGPQEKGWLDGFEADSLRLVSTLEELGDGRLPIVKAGGAGAELGPIAGVAVDLVVDLAKQGVGLAAAAAGASVGGVVGPLVGKAVEVLGGKLVDGAKDKVAERAAKPDRKGQANQDGDAGPAAEPPAELGTKVLDILDLAGITRWIAEQLGVDVMLRPDAVRVKSSLVSAKHGEESGGDELLNSFFAEDLDRIATAARGEDLGSGLTAYLASTRDIDIAARVDLRRDHLPGRDRTQPRDAPLGAWVSPPTQPLALSQQFAVNTIMAEIGRPQGSGLYAVNGPPGTGKTTMLRDLIAAIVVQRAEQLATLSSAAACFTGKAMTWTTEKQDGSTFTNRIKRLRPELTGYEILVASSNNGAVENVTLEIPSLKELKEPWHDRVRYLPEPAGLVHGDEVWGAVAARLGRRNLRGTFVEGFWWGQLPQAQGTQRTGQGLIDLLRRQQNDAAAAGTGPNDPDSGQTRMPLGTQTWTEAKAAFTAAREEVLRLVADRQAVADLLARTSGPDALLTALTGEAETAQGVTAQLEQGLRHAKKVSGEAEAYCADVRNLLAQRGTSERDAQYAASSALGGLEAAESLLAAHDGENRRPNRIKRLFSRGADARWEERRRPSILAQDAAYEYWQACEQYREACEEDRREAEQRLSHAQAAAARARREVESGEAAVAWAAAEAFGTRERLLVRRAELRAEREELDAARRRWGAAVPDPADWAAAPEDLAAMNRRERSSPWMDPELQEARSRLFVAALDLHRAVLATEPNLVRSYLNAAMEIVKGGAPADLREEIVLAAWQLLFLVVPVISTTFASLSRMLHPLGRGSLGWVFIDEAGQASPQQAVGAVWRARRTVVVGDPQQLEPVVTLPWTGQRRLCAHFDVDPQWAPGLQSVQTTADRLARYGAWLETKSGARVWVGSPLRVHRRCDRPMFEISNEIAYDNMMVYGKTEEPAAAFTLVARSTWFHVDASPGQDKWNPAEGVVLARTLELIADRLRERMFQEQQMPLKPGTLEPVWWEGGKPFERELARRVGESVFVVSPFRDVVRGMKKVAEPYFPEGSKRVGTVHTTQGKEADVVILVLGTAADADGSRSWATLSPNLVNVAVTRAKRRLIVIGDHALWAQLPNCGELARHPQIHVADRPWWKTEV